jgi:rhodanese-related sulfurtransferase
MQYTSPRIPRLFRLSFFIALFAFAASTPATENGKAEKKENKQLTSVLTVSLQEAKRLWDLGAVFIDVRSDEEWHLGRIKNARHVNFRRNFAKLKTLEGINSETPLVFYCSMPECKTGPYASAVSMEWGFKNVFYFPRGYFAWMLQDYPIDMESQLSPFEGEVVQIRKAK